MQNLYLCSMKKLLCPQCKIAAMYVKNEQGDRLLVYVLEDGEVVPKYPEDSMEGFDLTEGISGPAPRHSPLTSGPRQTGEPDMSGPYRTM